MSYLDYALLGVVRAAGLFLRPLSIAPQAPPPPPAVHVPAAAESANPTPRWECPCLACPDPQCEGRRPLGQHPEDGVAVCVTCGHRWEVVIGATPGLHASSREMFELMKLTDDDIALATDRRNAHDKVTNAAEGE